MKVQSIDRTFDLIELLSFEPNGLALTAIAQKVDLPISTVFRLLSNLVERGYVEKRDSGIYKIGLKFIEISALFLNRLELKTEAHPILVELTKRVGFVSFMAINIEDHVCYTDRVDTSDTLRSYSYIGQRRSLFSTGLGKSLLLRWEKDSLEKFILEHELTRRTHNTITDRKFLLKELEESRKRGWTYDNEEDQLGFRCIAAPVRDYRKEVIAAISVSWALEYFDEVDEEKVASAVVHAATEISKRLGCIWTS
ncbi:IclR family transcriptional regulator [Pleomorphochaeta sp. DL1XJH-081]|uniref:IclR family transcriptional regulator n=1 Tax=Pleomorphochaeta sp. DL1XJH-081 TaxID=3409690 RepID=UPI003BB488BC